MKECDCNLTRDIVDLIDREADLLNRGRGEKSLDGLRQRISHLFLQVRSKCMVVSGVPTFMPSAP